MWNQIGYLVVSEKSIVLSLAAVKWPVQLTVRKLRHRSVEIEAKPKSSPCGSQARNVHDQKWTHRDLLCLSVDLRNGSRSWPSHVNTWRNFGSNSDKSGYLNRSARLRRWKVSNSDGPTLFSISTDWLFAGQKKMLALSPETASIYFALGDKDAGFRVLREAYEHYSHDCNAQGRSCLSARFDPRYPDLIKRLRLP